MTIHENDTLLQVIQRLEQKVDAMSGELAALRQHVTEANLVGFRGVVHKNTVTLFGAIEDIRGRLPMASPRRVSPQAGRASGSLDFVGGVVAGAVLFDD